MKVKIEEKIEQKISSKIKELGFDIEYVECVKEGGKNIVRIVLDKEKDSVTIDDCEMVSRSIEEDIDQLVKNEYVLEVSSPGLERQLKNIKLFQKYIHSEIYIKLFKKQEDGKEFTGILKEVDFENEKITLEYENKEKEFLLKDIATAHTVYDFDAILKENSDHVNLNKLSRF